jgi:hypothetical protein
LLKSRPLFAGPFGDDEAVRLTNYCNAKNSSDRCDPLEWRSNVGLAIGEENRGRCDVIAVKITDIWSERSHAPCYGL